MKVAIITYDDREHYKDYGNPNPYFGTAPSALLQGFEAMPEHEVHVVSCTMSPMKSPEKLAHNIWFHSLHVPNIGWMKTAYQGCIRSVRRTLKRIQPDIVHGQGTERYAALAAVFSGFPSVLTIHGNMRLVARVLKSKTFSFQWLAARLESIAVPLAKGVVCITKYTQSAVAGSARRTWLVPNAVDKAFFDLSRRVSEDAPPRILCVGLICPRKNQNDFIRALDMVGQRQRFEVIFAGTAHNTDPYGAEFHSLTAARAWCRHEGFLNREQIRQMFSQASMLALPSLEDNCPMVVLEALAAGVPVLASRVGGIPELVQDKVHGRLFNPAEPGDMARAVETALAESDQTHAFAEAGKIMARERFHPSVIARRHISIYEEVLGASPRLRKA